LACVQRSPPYFANAFWKSGSANSLPARVLYSAVYWLMAAGSATAPMKDESHLASTTTVLS
jgi:hypothetical protein